MSWQASEHVRKLTGISAVEKAVLWALADRHSLDNNGCWPSIRRLAADVGLSPRATQDNLYRLRDKGVIRVSQQKRADGSLTSNFYQFVGLDDPDVVSTPLTQILRGVTRPAASHESSIEPKASSREIYDEVFRRYPEARSQIENPAAYFKKFDGSLDVDPANVAAVVIAADELRGHRPERIRIPAPSYWGNLDRVGAWLRKENGKLDRFALREAFDTAFSKVVGNKGGEGWDNILDGVAKAPEEFFTTYRVNSR